MRKAITIFLIAILFLCGLTISVPTSAADGDPDNGNSILPPSQPDPFLYAPVRLPDTFPIRIHESGKASDEEGLAAASARRWLDPKVFNSLSSAAQRAVLMLSRKRTQSARPGSIAPTATTPLLLLDQNENRIVNNLAFDTPTRNTQSETSICVDGENIIESFNDTTGPTSAYAFSTDGGNTFAHKHVPEASDQITLGDGVVALGPEGEIYYATLMFTGPRSFSAVGVAKSLDRGASFTTPVNASTTANNGLDFQDKEWIAVDRGSGSKFKGNVYVTWTDFSSHLFISFARSTDGGAHFSRPVNLSGSDGFNSVQGSNIVIGPAGEIHVAYTLSNTETGVSGIAYVRSTNGGKTFSAPRIIATPLRLPHVTGIGDVRANSFPNMAVGPHGDVHMVYGAQPELFGKDRSDVFYVRSIDGGDHWSDPVKLNDDNTTAAQWFPSVAVTPGGAVGVEFYDRRNSPQDSLTDVYMTISTDGGSHFGPNFRASNRNFLFGPVEPDLASGYHGDYNNMAVEGENFFLSWSGEGEGTPDAYFAKVSAARDPLAPDFIVSSEKLHDSVIAGGGADYDIIVNTVGGFSDDLVFDAVPQVPGITVSFDEVQAKAGQPVKLHLDTSPTTAPGSHLLTVEATGGGKTRATSIWVNVVLPGQFVSPPTNISKTTGYTFLLTPPQTDSAGNIHLAVYDDTESVAVGHRVYYMHSSDGGRSFSPRVQVSRDGERSALPIVRLDSEGKIFVAWQYDRFEIDGGALMNSRSGIAVSSSTDGGDTFSRPVDITVDSLVSPQMVEFFVNDNGSLNVLYASSAQNTGLFSVQSPDGGQTFAPPVQISLPSQVVGFPSAVSDGKGGIVTIYCDFASQFSQQQIPILLSRSGNGKAFSAPAQISVPGTFIAFYPPVLALGSDGAVYVLYHSFTAVPVNANTIDLFNPVVNFISSADGEHFSGPRLIAANGLLPAMTIDSNDNIYVAFAAIAPAAPGQFDGAPVMIARSNDKGLSFSIPMMASAPGALTDPTSVSLAKNATGDLNVQWTDFTPGPSPQIMSSISTDGGVTFAEPVNVSSDAGSAVSGFPVSNIDRTLAVFFNDDSAFNRELMSAVLPAPVPSPPDFALIDQSLSIKRKTSMKLVVSISRPGGFSGAVTVPAPESLPPGITLSPSQISTTTTNAVFDLTTSKKAQAGTYELIFTGKDDSGRSRFATITLTVQ